jgi:hypothetical protein
MSDVADSDDGIITGGVGEELDAAFWPASARRPAPQELKCPVRVAVRGFRSTLGGDGHGRGPVRLLIVADGSISAIAALSAATPKG